MIKWLVSAAVLGAQTTSPPPSPALRCVTRQQAGDLAVVGASIFVRGARTLCQAQVPNTAFLASPAAERYESTLRAEADRRFDSALAGIDRAFAGDASSAMVGVMLRGLMTGGPPPQIAGLLDAPNCADLSLMVEALSAMPPANMAQFASAALSMGSRMQQQAQARAAQRAAERAAEAAEADSDDDSEDPDLVAPPPIVRIPVVTDRERGPKPPRGAPPTARNDPPVMVPVMRPEPPRPTGPFVCPE